MKTTLSGRTTFREMVFALIAVGVPTLTYAAPALKPSAPVPALVPTRQPAHPLIMGVRISDFLKHLPPEELAKGPRSREARDAGQAALAAGDAKGAEVSFRASLLDAPNGESYLGLAESLAAQGRKQEALEAFTTLFNPGPSNTFGGTYLTRARLEYAILLNQVGKWNEAVEMYQKALPNLPGGTLPKPDAMFAADDPHPVALEAAAHIGLGLYDNWEGETDGNDRAFLEYTKALQLEPAWDVANYYYGFGWGRLGLKSRARAAHAKDAEAAFRKAASLGKEDVKREATDALRGF